jgi:hypothetical protein
MRRIPVASLLAVAALAVLAEAGGAASPPSYFGPLLDEVQNRISALPDPPATPEDRKAFKALDKARTLLAKEAKKPGFGRDAKTSTTCDKTLSRAFPEDATLEGLLDDLADALDVEIQARLDILETGIPATLAEGKTLTALQAARDAAQARLDGYGAETDRTGRLKVVKAAGAASDKVLARLAAAAMKALDTRGLDADVDGDPLTTRDPVGQLAFDASTRKLLNADVFGTEGEGEAARSISLHVDSLGPGGGDVEPGDTRSLSSDPQAQATYTESTRSAVSSTGSLTISCYDQRTGTVMGTFTFTGDYDTGGTATVTGGRFVARGLGTSSVTPPP